MKISTEHLIEELVSKNLGLSVKEISYTDKGASGSVFRVICDNSKAIAVKVSPHPELLLKEFEMLSLLKQRTSSKVPEVCFCDKSDGIGIMAMEYVDGVTCEDKSLKYKFLKRHLAESIIENLLNVQKAHNDKYGPYDNAIHDTWQEYYREFADEIYTFARSKYDCNELDNIVMRSIELSHKNLDKILSETVSLPTLTHGDYWTSNFIIDIDRMELVSAVDPFNVMWADAEYELFALNAGHGRKLHLYELYKEKAKVTEYCDVKTAMYALYSEMLWYKNGIQIEHSFLNKLSKRLIREMKKHRII